MNQSRYATFALAAISLLYIYFKGNFVLINTILTAVAFSALIAVRIIFSASQNSLIMLLQLCIAILIIFLNGFFNINGSKLDEYINLLFPISFISSLYGFYLNRK